MPKLFFLLVSFFPFAISGFSQSEIQWQKCFGGLRNDIPYEIIRANDGGYIAVGSSESGGIQDSNDVSANFGGSDFWVIKVSEEGNLLWEHHYGGSQNDVANQVIQLSTGEILISGYSFSMDRDVSEHSPPAVNSQNEILPNPDFWIIQINSDGAIQWEKALGGSYVDESFSMIETKDHHIMLAGFSASNNGIVTGNIGEYDFLVVKMDLYGNVKWKKNYGGTRDDRATNIIECREGGFLVSGFSSSSDNHISENFGLYDFCLFRIDDQGEIVWQKTLGGSRDDRALSSVQTDDDGFLVAGFTWSHDVYINNFFGEQDGWLIKLDKHGNLQWEKTMGGTQNDEFTNLVSINGIGYLVSGTSYSSGGLAISNNGSSDCWITQLDLNGNYMWSHTYGGSAAEKLNSIISTSEGGYIFAASTSSDNFHVSGNKGNDDFWIVKLSSSVGMNNFEAPFNEISFYPNPGKGDLNFSEAGNSDLNETATITVSDMTGKIIIHRQFTPSELKHQKLNLEFLENGLYAIQVNTSNCSFIQKLIILN